MVGMGMCQIGIPWGQVWVPERFKRDGFAQPRYDLHRGLEISFG